MSWRRKEDKGTNIGMHRNSSVGVTSYPLHQLQISTCCPAREDVVTGGRVGIGIAPSSQSQGLAGGDVRPSFRSRRGGTRSRVAGMCGHGEREGQREMHN